MKILTFKKAALQAICFGILSLFALKAWSEVAIIVHPSVDVSASAEDIERLFLGKSKDLQGTKLIPINLEAGNPARNEFNAKILKKSDAQLKSYWSRLVFTGKAQPPKDVGSEADVVGLVKSNPNMIGYVSPANATDGVKVLSSF